MEKEVANLEQKIVGLIEQYVISTGNARENIKTVLYQKYDLYRSYWLSFPNLLMPNYWGISEFMSHENEHYQNCYDNDRHQEQGAGR